MLNSIELIVGLCAAAVLVLIVIFVFVRMRKRRPEDESAAAKGGAQSGLSSAADACEETESGQDEEADLPGNCLLVGKLHEIGSRSSQQDSFGISRDGDIVSTEGIGVAALLADGMGGLKDGDQVSMHVGIAMLKAFDAQPERMRGDQKLLAMLNSANDDVNTMQTRSGQKKSGSTVVAALIQENSMYWLSVGDSHIYLSRDGELLQLNRDHVYAVELDEKAARGEISVKAAMEDPQRKALTSYIGMGKIEKIDRNTRPVRLQTGDRILLMSDGVFGTLSDEEIAEAMKLSVQEACRMLGQMIQEKNRTGQDNYTALVLEYR